MNMTEKDPYFIADCELKMGVTTCVDGNCGANRQSVEDFIGYIQLHGSPVNYMMYLGHNFLRSAVGISYGIEYSPGIKTEEIVDLAGILDSDKYLLSAHFKSDVGKSVEAITELIEFSKMSKLPMQISHIGSCSAYGYMDESLRTIIKARMEGADIFADCYPYDAFGTFIRPAVFDDGCFEKWDRTYSDVLLTEEPFQAPFVFVGSDGCRCCNF
ncbi:MAG: Dihydroorotase [Clostridiales bacterium 38_11]|nr:MAG: Dihydroorotase [Clostridiales bacterium 38_11]HBH13229.1 hypothetical protein [Clostridiales bacterium]